MVEFLPRLQVSLPMEAATVCPRHHLRAAATPSTDTLLFLIDNMTPQWRREKIMVHMAISNRRSLHEIRILYQADSMGQTQEKIVDTAPKGLRSRLETLCPTNTMMPQENQEKNVDIVVTNGHRYLRELIPLWPTAVMMPEWKYEKIVDIVISGRKSLREKVVFQTLGDTMTGQLR